MSCRGGDYIFISGLAERIEVDMSEVITRARPNGKAVSAVLPRHRTCLDSQRKQLHDNSSRTCIAHSLSFYVRSAPRKLPDAIS